MGDLQDNLEPFDAIQLLEILGGENPLLSGI
jgi:hypothetical protein